MTKTFTGSYCLLVILLCCYIIPGILYYIIAQKEVGVVGTPVQQQITHNVYISTPEAQLPKKDSFCTNCGTRKTGATCEQCGK